MPICSVTVALDDPERVDPLTVIQAASAAAVHEQPESVETPTDNPPPAAPMLSLDLLSSYVHGAAAWLTWTCSDPIAIDPVRADGAGLLATA
jgi:hypothetical protein